MLTFKFNVQLRELPVRALDRTMSSKLSGVLGFHAHNILIYLKENIFSTTKCGFEIHMQLLVETAFLNKLVECYSQYFRQAEHARIQQKRMRAGAFFFRRGVVFKLKQSTEDSKERKVLRVSCGRPRRISKYNLKLE